MKWAGQAPSQVYGGLDTWVSNLDGDCGLEVGCGTTRLSSPKTLRSGVYMGPSVPEVLGLGFEAVGWDSWIPRPARLGKVPRRGQSWGCGGVRCTWGGAGRD